MKETDIRKYAKLMKELELTGLEITEENQTVRLERAVSPSAKEINLSSTETVTGKSDNPDNADYISVKSPVVGVFYSSPAENAAPFVLIGENVKKGQTLCVVEAMKLMNEVIAEEDGVISEVCVTNGQVVEYGTELFHIKR